MSLKRIWLPAIKVKTYLTVYVYLIIWLSLCVCVYIYMHIYRASSCQIDPIEGEGHLNIEKWLQGCSLKVNLFFPVRGIYWGFLFSWFRHICDFQVFNYKRFYFETEKTNSLQKENNNSYYRTSKNNFIIHTVTSSQCRWLIQKSYNAFSNLSRFKVSFFQPINVLREEPQIITRLLKTAKIFTINPVRPQRNEK